METNIEQARFNMVEQQVRPWDVLDQQVLDLLLRVPREAFVPAHLRALAFADTMLPLENGELMLEPKLEARMVQALALQPDDKVLEVGTGSGYLTALLASLAARVVSVELDSEMMAAAQQGLAAHGIDNVDFYLGNGAGGWEAEQPYDAIVLGGAVAAIPQALKEQLQVGGRLFAVVGEAPAMQGMLLTRLNMKEWREWVLFETVIPPLRECHGTRGFVF